MSQMSTSPIRIVNAWCVAYLDSVASLLPCKPFLARGVMEVLRIAAHDHQTAHLLGWITSYAWLGCRHFHSYCLSCPSPTPHQTGTATPLPHTPTKGKRSPNKSKRKSTQVRMPSQSKTDSLAIQPTAI